MPGNVISMKYILYGLYLKGPYIMAVKMGVSMSN